MRIAHWSIWAPHRSGLYHTTKDLVVAQRQAGIECGFINAQDGQSRTDGQFASDDFRYADTADIYMMHLAVPEPYYSDGTPLVIVLHGNPLYSMQTELYNLEAGNPAPWTTILTYFNRQQPTWFLSMWEDEQRGYWDCIAGEYQRHRMWYAPRGIVFGDEWSPEGPKRDLEGDPVIVIADQFRLFKDALPTLFGAYRYWVENPKTRVHIYGLPEVGHEAREKLERWLMRSGLHRMIGSLNGIVDYLPDVFRSADILLSTVTGESRVVLEAMACGCAVVGPWKGATVCVDRFWEADILDAEIARTLGGGMGQARRQKAVAKAVETLEELCPDLLKTGVTAEDVADMNAVALAGGIECVAGSPMKTRSETAEWVREKYDIAQTVEALGGLYADVMENA